MTDGLNAPDPVRYLDHAAATDPARRYKREMVKALDIRSGQTVLDVGCGLGADLAALADAVGPRGTVLGVDCDPRMVAEASARLASRANVEIRLGDALYRQEYGCEFLAAPGSVFSADVLAAMFGKGGIDAEDDDSEHPAPAQNGARFAL